MAERRACQGGQGRGSVRGGAIEPVDEDLHLARHLRGERGLEMHHWPVHPSGNDLHRIVMSPVGADRFQPTVMGQEHPVPVAKCFPGEGAANPDTKEEQLVKGGYIITDELV